MLKGVFAGLRVASFLRSDEAKAVLPKAFSCDELRPFPAEISDFQLDKYSDLCAALEDAQYDHVCDQLDASYDAKSYISEGLYECEYFAYILGEELQEAYGSIEKTRNTVGKYADWHNSDRTNPYAAASYAQALHDHGFAYRGNDWIDSVSDEGKYKLQEYSDLAREVFEATRASCSQNWFWRKVFLGIATTDYHGADEHIKRFEDAREALPLSTDVYTTMVTQMLPRWHGSYPRLRHFLNMVYYDTVALCDDMMFLTVLDMVRFKEETILVDHLPSFEILKEVADVRSHMSDDFSKGIAAAFYYWLGDYNRVAEIMPTIDNLNKSFWYHDADPEYAAAHSYLMLR